MTTLTPTQRTALRALEQFSEQQRWLAAPTQQEFAQLLGCASKSSAHRLFTILEHKGLIEFDSTHDGFRRSRMRFTQAGLIALAEIADNNPAPRREAKRSK